MKVLFGEDSRWLYTLFLQNRYLCISIFMGIGLKTDISIKQSKLSILTTMVLGWNQDFLCKNRKKTFIQLQLKRTSVGKILENNKRQFGIKITSNRYIYLSGLKYHETEGHLSWDNVYKKLLLILLQGLENTQNDKNVQTIST